MQTKLAKDRKRIPLGECIANDSCTLPVIIACKVVITSELVSVISGKAEDIN